jgi:hypothetical protein
MAPGFSGSAVVDRPIAEVYAYLADGTHDPEFSPRILKITREPAGPPAVGTIFVSRAKDAGMTTDRRFELTELVEPTTIRWAERSQNMITVTDGGYDLEAVDETHTRVTIFNNFAGHGLGKLIVGLAAKAAAKDADAFAGRIKKAVESR